MAKFAVDIGANIARAATERVVRKDIDARLKSARAMIAAARKISVEDVGLDATEELLLNELYNLRDDQQHRDLMRSLRRVRA